MIADARGKRQASGSGRVEAGQKRDQNWPAWSAARAAAVATILLRRRAPRYSSGDMGGRLNDARCSATVATTIPESLSWIANVSGSTAATPNGRKTSAGKSLVLKVTITSAT